MDDFESQDQDFPGLYTPGTSKGKKEEQEFAEKKEKKDKKDKKDKDKGYATLAGDSSPDEEGDTKSPSKSSKRIKAFKFPLKKEKREKSRDKEVLEREPADGKEKKRDKKEKKDKKVKSAGTAEEPQELGDVLPIFGVSLQSAVERSRCHDMDAPLPLVVRDCIDYLQTQTRNENIYKVEPVGAKVQHLKKLYNNRESGFAELDVHTAAGLLKLFLKELPEPILTTALVSKFEEASAISDVQEQEEQLRDLVAQLPAVNRTLLKWIALHLDAVTENETMHKLNAQSLAMLLENSLQMSHRLFVTLLCHCRSLFPGTTDPILPRYIPPLSDASLVPEAKDEILLELMKQESVLTEIHTEMNCGFVAKHREEKLWEVQRIITQLKRKLRQFDKKGDNAQKSIEDTVDSTGGVVKLKSVVGQQSATPGSLEEQPQPTTTLSLVVTETGFLALPPDHPEAVDFHRLQMENYELHRLREQLQAAINQERSEILSLKRRLNEVKPQHPEVATSPEPNPNERAELRKQNDYLESIRQMLCEEIMEERKRIVSVRAQLLCLAE